MAINRVNNQNRIQAKKGDLHIDFLSSEILQFIIAFILHYSSFALILISTSTKNGREGLEPDQKRRGRPQ
jgi:hypothetical protein